MPEIGKSKAERVGEDSDRNPIFPVQERNGGGSDESDIEFESIG